MVHITPIMDTLDLEELRRWVEETAIAAGALVRSAQPAQLIIETKKNGMPRYHHESRNEH